MNAAEFVKATARTDGDSAHYSEASERYADNAEMLHYAIGICGESGELIDAVKKHVQYGRSLDLDNIKEEIGDILWFIARICDFYGWSIEEVMAGNIAKLQVRFPEKFTQEAEQNINTTEEMTALENAAKVEQLANKWSK